MSPASSGNKFLNHSYSFEIEDVTQVGEVRRFVQNLAIDLNFTEVQSGRLGIIVNELGNNLTKYADQGKLLIRQQVAGEYSYVEIISTDKGPGFDSDLAIQDGYTTGSTPGTGLGAIKRQADEFDIYSERRGTVIYARINASDVPPAHRYQLSAINIPLKGETICGDAWSSKESDNQLELFMADGLGHGILANQAALEAVEVFKNSSSSRLDMLIQSVHARLKSTRGAAVFALRVQGKSLEFSGVGNIRTLVHSADSSKTLISQNGTAGLQIRAARPLTHSWDEEGYLILHSDGLATKWTLKEYPGLYSKHPAIICGVLYRDYNRGNDDLTVVVARRILQ